MVTVLVVEDEFGISELFEAILGEVGFDVVSAINGRQALDILAHTRADLIFLDYMMPVMNGAAMLPALAADPTLQGIPVVIMSSLPETAVAERCSGYVAFLRKPFKVEQVIGLAQRLAGGTLEGADPPDAG